jgi:hypothetical protein
VRLSRSAARELAAWLVTGPLGHLYSAVADITLLWLRYGRTLAARRLRSGAGSAR